MCHRTSRLLESPFQVGAANTHMSRDTTHDGGLFVTPQMKTILDKPGFISVRMGSESLRNMFQDQFAEFNPNRLSQFARACMFGNYHAVREAIESGTAPDLNSTQTPFQFGFVALAVLGARQLQPISFGGAPMRHLDTISHLIDAGASPDLPDVSGHTALHHACTPPGGNAPTARRLVEKGANVNAQNRYGEVPIFFPFQGGDVALVDILMEHGADLDIPNGNGDSPRKMCVVFGPEVTAAVQRWERKRKGEVAPWEEKRCENCKLKGKGMSLCSRCRVVRYCSTECQRAHWKTHKPNCNPFCAQTTVTLKPSYDGGVDGGVSQTLSTADLVRRSFGLAPPSTASPFRPGLTRNEAENKHMVIKIQVPRVDLLAVAHLPAVAGALLIYNKKRNFVCTVERAKCPDAYDAVVQVVQARGVNKAKAYFVAELKNPDELVVKISEVLAEQPF